MSDWPDFDPSTSNCRQNYSFFTTSDFMIYSYHLSAIINIPLSILTFYLISAKTPTAMRKMKPALIFAQICSTNLDLICNVLSCPYAFFPTASGVTLGILSKLGMGFKWQGYWGQVAIALNGVAFVMLYENRQSQITTINWKITKESTRRVYCIVLIVLAFMSMLPFYIEDFDQLELRKIVLARIPCPTIEFFNANTYVVLKGGEAAPFYSMSLVMCYVVFQSFFFGIQSIFHVIIVPNANLSRATKKLQRKFLGCVTLQITIPMMVLVFPSSYSLYADKYNYYNQAYNNFALLAFGCHGFLATTTTLMIYKPYRDVVFAPFRGKVEVAPSSVIEPTRDMSVVD